MRSSDLLVRGNTREKLNDIPRVHADNYGEQVAMFDAIVVSNVVTSVTVHVFSLEAYDHTRSDDGNGAPNFEA